MPNNNNDRPPPPWRSHEPAELARAILEQEHLPIHHTRISDSFREIIAHFDQVLGSMVMLEDPPEVAPVISEPELDSEPEPEPESESESEADSESEPEPEIDAARELSAEERSKENTEMLNLYQESAENPPIDDEPEHRRTEESEEFNQRMIDEYQETAENPPIDEAQDFITRSLAQMGAHARRIQNILHPEPGNHEANERRRLIEQYLQRLSYVAAPRQSEEVVADPAREERIRRERDYAALIEDRNERAARDRERIETGQQLAQQRRQIADYIFVPEEAPEQEDEEIMYLGRLQRTSWLEDYPDPDWERDLDLEMELENQKPIYDFLNVEEQDEQEIERLEAEEAKIQDMENAEKRRRAKERRVEAQRLREESRQRRLANSRKVGGRQAEKERLRREAHKKKEKEAKEKARREREATERERQEARRREAERIARIPEEERRAELRVRQQHRQMLPRDEHRFGDLPEEAWFLRERARLHAEVTRVREENERMLQEVLGPEIHPPRRRSPRAELSPGLTNLRNRRINELLQVMLNPHNRHQFRFQFLNADTYETSTIRLFVPMLISMRVLGSSPRLQILWEERRRRAADFERHAEWFFWNSRDREVGKVKEVLRMTERNGKREIGEGKGPVCRVEGVLRPRKRGKSGYCMLQFPVQRP